ncbi:component of the polarisome [Irineochytrium annulatum]|nr:component of the polarisome [Irineochytrium annulatum]
MADDATFTSYYEELRQYLEQYLQTQKGNPSSQRASAREKLTKLTKQQFTELATDVYDEMKRRLLNSPEVRDDLHPKRNQARSKLATLPTSRFKDLASDVFYEIERRYPLAVQNYEQKYGIPQGVDGSEVSMRNGQEAGISSLDNLMADLGSILSPNAGDKGLSKESGDRPRSDDARVEALQGRIAQLEKENTAVRADMEEKLAQQIKINKDLETSLAKLQAEHAKLTEDYAGLQDDYNNQQQIAQDIRTEATNLLTEIKSLSKRNEELIAERDRAISNSQSAPASDTKGYADPPSTLSGITGSAIIDTGRINAYELAVGDLLKAAKSDTPTSVLVAMKSIVIACKNITEDTEAFENSSDSITPADKERLEDVKNKLSHSLTNLMTSAKNHATNFGNVPVELLEVSSGELSATIVELVNLLKSYHDAGRQTNGSHGAGETFDIDDLKLFLEKQTDLIVQAIQTLLYAMRNQTGAFGQEFKDTVSGITSIVENLVAVSRRTLSTPSASAFKQRGEKILEDLSAANLNLEQLGVSMVNSPQSKTLKQRLASSSYEIAKYVKELIGLIE